MKNQSIDYMLFKFLSISFVILFSINVSNLFGQSKSETYNMGNNTVIRSIVKRGEVGFFISSSSESNDRKNNPTNIKIAYFNSNLTKQWEVIEPAGDLKSRSNRFIVASDVSDYSYWMASVYNNKKGEDVPAPGRVIHISRFDQNGKAERFKTEITESGSEVNLMHVYCDKDKLYYFSVKTNEASGGKMKNPEEIFMYTMGHKEKKFQKKKLELDLKQYGQISFLSHTDSGFYLCQKRIAMGGNKMEIDIIKLLNDGTVLETFTIIPKIKNYYLPLEFSSDNYWNGDYDQSLGSKITKQTANTTYVAILPNCLVDVVHDQKNKRFCVYGLTSNTNDQQALKGGPATAILLQTYSLKGEKLSANSIALTESEANNMVITKSCAFSLKELNFNIISEDIFKFDISYVMYDAADKTSTFYTNKKDILFSKKEQLFEIEKIQLMNQKIFMKEFGWDCPMRTKLKYGLNVSEDYVPISYFSYLEPIKHFNSRHLGYASMPLGNNTLLFKIEDIRGDTQIELMLF